MSISISLFSSNGEPNNTAYTARGLENHTDLPYFEIPPGYQFLHCLVNDAEGGDSSAVDGFAVAEYVKKNDPETFELLKWNLSAGKTRNTF